MPDKSYLIQSGKAILHTILERRRKAFCLSLRVVSIKEVFQRNKYRILTSDVLKELQGFLAGRDLQSSP
jgi:hypothetical protein